MPPFFFCAQIKRFSRRPDTLVELTLGFRGPCISDWHSVESRYCQRHTKPEFAGFRCASRDGTSGPASVRLIATKSFYERFLIAA